MAACMSQRVTNRVGINTINPLYALDVGGTVNALSYLGAADASLITSGVFGPVRLGSNTPVAGWFLRSDMVWAPTTGGGGGAATTNTTATFVIPAAGGFTTVTVADPSVLLTNQLVYISDGTSTITSQITNITGSTIQILTQIINTGTAGTTMGSGAAVGPSQPSTNAFSTLQLPHTLNPATGVIFFGTTPGLRVQGGTSSSIFLGNAGNYVGGAGLIGIGDGAMGAQNGTGQFNIAIGISAMQNLVGGISNLTAGYQAGQVLTGTVQNNIALGTNSLPAQTTGNNNIGLGLFAGYLGGTSLSNGVYIGAYANNPDASTDGGMSIQNAIFGTGNTNVVPQNIAGGRLGFYRTNPQAKMDLAGNFYADNEVLAAQYYDRTTALGTVGASFTANWGLTATVTATLTAATPCTATFSSPLLPNTLCFLRLTCAAGATLTVAGGVVAGTLPTLPSSGNVLLVFRWDGTNYHYIPAGVLAGAGSVPGGGTNANFFRGDNTFASTLLGPIGSGDPSHTTETGTFAGLSDGTNQYINFAQQSSGTRQQNRYWDFDGRVVVGNNLTPASGGVVIDSPAQERLFVDAIVRSTSYFRANGGYYGRIVTNSSTPTTLSLNNFDATYAVLSGFSGNTTITLSDSNTVPSNTGYRFSGMQTVEIQAPGANTITFAVSGGSITWLTGSQPTASTTGITVYRFIYRQGVSGCLGYAEPQAGATYTDANARVAVATNFNSTSSIVAVSAAQVAGDVPSFTWTVPALGITNAMLAGSINPSKLLGYPSDSTKALFGDGSWRVPSGGGGGSSIQFQSSGTNQGTAGQYSTYNFLSGFTLTGPSTTVNVSPDLAVLQGRVAYQIAGSTQNTNPAVPLTTINYASGITGTYASGVLTLNAAGGGGSFSPATRYAWTAPQSFSVSSFPASSPYSTINATSSVYINDYYPNTAPDGANGFRIQAQNNDPGGNYKAVSIYQQNNTSSSNATVQSWTKNQHVPSSGFSTANYFVSETSNLAAGGSVSDVFYPNSWGPCSLFASTPDGTGVTHSFGTGGHIRIGEFNYGNAWADFGYYDTLPVGGSKVSGVSLSSPTGCRERPGRCTLQHRSTTSALR